MRTAVFVPLFCALACACVAQDRKEVKAEPLYPSTMRAGQIGRFEGKKGKPAALEVCEVCLGDTLLIVEHASEPGRKFILKFKGHKLAEGSVITDFKAISKSGLFEIKGPTKRMRDGGTYWTVVPHDPDAPARPPERAPRKTPARPTPRPVPKVEPKDDAIGMLTARNKAAELKGQRATITGIVSSWEASGDSITLTFRAGGSRVCEFTLVGAQRKTIPPDVPPSSWRITVEATVNGKRDGMLDLSDVKVVGVEK